MTTLFISHGAPDLVPSPGKSGVLLKELGTTLPRPRAILVVSAHWDTMEARVSSVAHPDTLHDFIDFPDEMYGMQYPAPGAPELAKRVMDAFRLARMNIQEDKFRGLDHGAWVPLMLMYPSADIPVTQLSIMGHMKPADHYKIGQAIGILQDYGVMILCSGAITHNLKHLFRVQRKTSSLHYVNEFSNWVGERVVNHDIESLLNYRKVSINGVKARPHEDHILPLFVAMGAGRGQVQRFQPEGRYSALAMDTYVWK